MTWGEIFERGAANDVSVEAIRETLAERRQR